MEFSKRVKNEALRRLSELSEVFSLNPSLVENLKEERVYYSHQVAGCGRFDAIDTNEKYKEVINFFQMLYDAYVYHAIETHTTLFGTMLTLLYVSENEREWSEEQLEGCYIFSFVQGVNGEIDEILDGEVLDGEFGSVVLTSDNGVLIRRG